MSSYCKECGVKLANRNRKRLANGLYKSRGLCQPCFNSPKEKDRCIAPTHKGRKTCLHRKCEDSKLGYCSYHHKRLER